MGRFPLRDTFFLKAKREGFRARSAYKLLEIQRRFHPIKKGDRLLDLGCSPGSFIQVARAIVGEEGFIVGVDILDTQPFSSKNIVILKMDVCKMDVREILERFGFDFFDVITSDVSPNISGVREVDEENRKNVYEAIKRIIRSGLRKGGNCVIKSFFTESFSSIKDDLYRIFKELHVFKPQASRKTSPEVYLVCLNKN